MRAGFVISLFRYSSIYPAMNISYLSLPNCSGNFNRLDAFGAVLCDNLRYTSFTSTFDTSLRCTCAAASSSSIQLSTSDKILSAIAASVYPIDHRVLLRVCLLSRK